MTGVFPSFPWGSSYASGGAALAGQNSEWTRNRRCMGPEILATCRQEAECSIRHRLIGVTTEPLTIR